LIASTARERTVLAGLRLRGVDTRVVAEVRQRLVRGRLETVRLNLVPGRVFVAEPPPGLGWDLFRDVGIIRFLGADATLVRMGGSDLAAWQEYVDGQTAQQSRDSSLKPTCPCTVGDAVIVTMLGERGDVLSRVAGVCEAVGSKYAKIACEPCRAVPRTTSDFAEIVFAILWRCGEARTPPHSRTHSTGPGRR
jgi:hypothetical protein